VVYTAWSLSLAALEYLVHVDRDLVPDDLVRVEIEIPEGLRIRRIGPKDLPRNWRSYPGPVRLRQIGDQWMEDRKSPVLQVPSVLIPEEHNYLINPGHSEAGKIRKLSTKSFAYDSRL
jgi:RES domain-containing protein